MVALLLSRFEFRGKGLLTGLAILPLIVPYFVLGVALLILFTAFDISLSLATVAIGHAVDRAALHDADRPRSVLGAERAARGGGDGPRRDVPRRRCGSFVIPMAVPAIISAWITAFTVSFDEFAIALFLAGKDPTFPVFLYGQLRFANTLPVLIAAGGPADGGDV